MSRGLRGVCQVLASLIVLPGAAATTVAAEPAKADVFQDRVYRDDTGEHRYAVFVPPGYTPDKKWPVILFLHGAGERGRDGRAMLDVGLGPVVRRHPERFPAIIVFPQVESVQDRILTAWSPDRPDGARALKILEDVESRFAIDPSHRILTGWSMGGYGVWRLAAATPAGFWSAVLPLAGGAPAEIAAAIPDKTPLWTIHGGRDRIVLEKEMTTAVDAARAAGRSVHSTVLPDVGHDVWKVAYSKPEVVQWMFDPSNVEPASVMWSDEEIKRLTEENPADERPFVARSIISRAVAVRITNEAFREVARGIPSAVAPDRLRGNVADIEQELQYGGETIRASITGIQWTTELDHVEIHAATAEKLEVRVGLKNLTLQAAGGTIQGGPYRATCGPFAIRIGCWRPVIVDVATRPTDIDGVIRFRQREIQFQIPDDNWIVEEPGDATASGPGLTPELVKTGVVGGMYQAKARVEDSVRELIPPLIDRIEERLQVVPPGSFASVLWPLPTIPPPIRLRAEAIRTDRDGISATIAVVVGATDDQTSTAQPTTIDTVAGIDESGASGVSIGVSPSVITSLAEAFRESNEATIDVLDAPEPEFARLADPELLMAAAPDLARLRDTHDFRTQFRLAEPFSLQLLPAVADGRGLALDVDAPGLLLTTSARKKRETGPWTPCVEFPFSLKQSLHVSLQDSLGTGRPVEVRWGADSQLTGSGRFAPGYEPKDSTLHAETVLATFRSAWTKWTTTMTATSEVDDLAVGDSRLHLDRLPIRSDRVWLQFTPTQTPAATDTRRVGPRAFSGRE